MEPPPRLNVLMVGAGGLACGIALALKHHCEEPSFCLHIVDGDVIERSNLNRQVLFTESDLGQAKASVLEKRVMELRDPSPAGFTVRSSKLFFSLETADELLSEIDFVLDATDSIEAKLLINDLCVARGIAFCYAGVSGFSGALMKVTPGRTSGSLSEETSPSGCLRCLFGDSNIEDSSEEERTCQQAGIIGPVAGLLGLLQVQEFFSFLKAPLQSTPSKLIRYSCLPPRLNTLIVPAARDCPLGCAFHTRQHFDLRDKQCPETFLYAKLALEDVPPATVLDLRFSSEADAQNVRKSLAEEGHTPLGRIIPVGAKSWRLLLKKQG